jgi:putative acetyltransferase
MGLIRGSQYCDFKVTDSDYDITVKLWPIVKGIVMTAIENNQHLIVEGCYIPTNCPESFETKYSKEIISFFIGFSEHYLSNNFESGIIDHLRTIENKVLDDYIQPENFKKMHAQVKASCVENHATYFEIDNDYLVETKAIYEWIDDKIKGRHVS